MRRSVCLSLMLYNPCRRGLRSLVDQQSRQCLVRESSKAELPRQVSIEAVESRNRRKRRAAWNGRCNCDPNRRLFLLSRQPEKSGKVSEWCLFQINAERQDRRWNAFQTNGDMAIEAKYTCDKKMEMMKPLQTSLVMQSEESAEECTNLVFAVLVFPTAQPPLDRRRMFCSLGRST